MHALRHHLELRRWLAVWLIGAALLVKLLVPAGYMPMAGKAGLAICGGQIAGPAAAMPAMHAMAGMPGMDHGAHHDAPDPKPTDHSCPFASVGGMFDLPNVILPAVVAPVATATLIVQPFLSRPGLGLAAPPPPKTGPPVILR